MKVFCFRCQDGRGSIQLPKIFPKSISDAWVLIYIVAFAARDDGKLWEIAWGELRQDRGGDTSEKTGWTDGKSWEIVWGELCWEGARQKRRQGQRTGNREK